MHYTFTCKTTIPLFFIVLAQYSHAQQKLTKVDSILYYHKIQFIQEASFILSQSLKEENWIQIENFTENWKTSETPSDELIFSINALLAIQNNKFSVVQFPCDFMYLLEDYAKELKNANENSSTFKYNIKLTTKYRYDATADVQKLQKVLQTWSLRLQAGRKLSRTELFLCRVFSGEIAHPRTAFESDKKSYTDMYAFEHNLDLNNNAFFVTERNRHVGTAAIMVGSWFPTGNLRTLGSHPSVGISLGVRDKKNEYDVVWNFRFLNPTPHSYQVLRNDTLYNSNYYDGGYIGLDYTRYIIHKTKYELGLISAIGYDYFSIANGFGGSDTNSKMIPLNVGSFDFSNGFRFKYFLGPKSYIGVAAKYHLINYCNSGGTDLGGHAFTIDLIFGSH